jgi:hypothetical protein
MDPTATAPLGMAGLMLPRVGFGGAAAPDEVRANVEAFGHDIPAALRQELKHEGLIAPEAPTP